MPLFMMRRMHQQTWTTAPCKRCGKTPRTDYDGYCLDCADTLALRGLLAPLPGQNAGEALADPETTKTTDEEAR
jgi:hypothetical protein